MKISKLILGNLLIIFLTLALVYAAENTGKAKNLALIVVKGADYVEAMPDTAYFNLNVSIEKDSPEEAASLGEQLQKNIRDVFDKNSILKKDIIEEATDISSRYDYENKKTVQVFVYRAKLRLTDFSKIAQLRNDIFNPETFAPVKDSWFSRRGLTAQSDVAYEIVQNKAELQQKAVKKAYDIALLKIKGIAETSALKYRIHGVIESGVNISDNRPVFRSMGLNAAPAALGFNKEEAVPAAEDTIPSLQRIDSEVTVEAEIL